MAGSPTYTTTRRYEPAGVGQGIQVLLSDGTYHRLSTDDVPGLVNPNDIVQYQEGLMTEAGSGTYTLTFAIPNGATVRDVVVSNDAVWNVGTSATFKCGDTDSDHGYFTALNVKTTPAADGTTGGGSSNMLQGSGSGTYKGLFKRYANGDNIVAVVTAVGTGGTTGKTRVRVYYSVPSAVIAAVKS